MRALVEYDLNDLGTLVKQIAKIMQFLNRNNRNEIRIWCIYGVFLFCNGLYLPIFFLVLGFVLQMTDDAIIGTNILKICARAF